ncbi:MAG: phosphatase PAP2 family protein [Gemmatimonadota bacterium]
MTDVERGYPIRLTTLRAVTMFGVAALIAFVLLAYGVTHKGALTAFDLRDLARRQSTVTEAGQRFSVIVSLVGSPASMTLLAVFGALWLVWHRRILLLVSWITAFAGANLLVVVFKRTIHRSRPVGAELFLHGASLSFPSGHALGSVVGFGMLTYLLALYGVKGEIRRTCLVVIAASIAGFVAYSRLYLGVHYMSDVIAGLALGAVWLIICVLAAEFAHRKRARRHA